MPAGKRTRSRRKRGTQSSPQTKPRRRRRSRGAKTSGILATVQAAREAAANALQGLRAEIRQVQARLEKLIESERTFRNELFGGAGGSAKRPAAPRRPRRKGPPVADRFFSKLPQKFTLEDVRKVAGRLSGVSLAQWSRAKKIKKTGNGYQKAA